MELRFFDRSEFDCQATGENQMSDLYLLRMDTLRERVGFPLVVTSGYRSVKHPIEMAKDIPGVHTYGIAGDYLVQNGVQRRKLVQEALRMGFSGIGVAKTFVHIDDRELEDFRDPTPVLWTY